MKKSFLGKGWRFPVSINERGNVDLSEYEENIEESICLILGTALGERVMRPDFGCKIHDFIFYPNNATTSSLVGYYAREALVKWEPRIEDIEVIAYPDPSEDNVLLINISYKVITTNNVRNLVYPFYLRREELI